MYWIAIIAQLHIDKLVFLSEIQAVHCQATKIAYLWTVVPYTDLKLLFQFSNINQMEVYYHFWPLIQGNIITNNGLDGPCGVVILRKLYRFWHIHTYVGFNVGNFVVVVFFCVCLFWHLKRVAQFYINYKWHRSKKITNTHTRTETKPIQIQTERTTKLRTIFEWNERQKRSEQIFSL